MSRGHGKWERAILAALDQTPAFYLTDLLPKPHTRSHVVALNRAARCLIAAGKVQAMHWCTRGGAGLGYVTVYRFDHLKPTDRAQVTHLKRCTADSMQTVQHLTEPAG
jgi:hypothetical protein